MPTQNSQRMELLLKATVIVDAASLEANDSK